MISHNTGMGERMWKMSVNVEPVSELDEKRHNLGLVIEEEVDDQQIFHTFNTSSLKHTGAQMMSLSPNYVLLILETELTASDKLTSEETKNDVHVIVRCLLDLIQPLSTLPHEQHSPSSGLVATPDFDGVYKRYLRHYKGDFWLNVSHSQSVFVTFSLFDLDDQINGRCSKALVELEVYSESFSGAVWRKCSRQHVGPELYRGSLRLVFISDTGNDTDFRMIYAVLPREHEPQIIPSTDSQEAL
jgi:hypothetical protein